MVFTCSGKRGCYELLLEILNEDPTKEWQPRLQHSSENLTYMQLASSLVKFGLAKTPQVTAPIVYNGYFAHALPLAVKKMERFKRENQTLVDFATEIFASMFKKMEIHFLPWHREATGHGPRPRMVQADWWMTVDRATGGVSTIVANEREAETSTSVAMSIAAENPSAPWSIPKKLRDMGTLWRKRTRPDEWTLKDASLNNARRQEEARYISDTYDYVDQVYDGSDWRHHMALVWAILFSRVVPMISHDKEIQYSKATNAKAATKTVQDIPWKKSEGRRGVTESRPYVVMLSTAIIALRDKKSPLAKRAEKNKNALGKPWTDKHGKRRDEPRFYERRLTMWQE